MKHYTMVFSTFLKQLTQTSAVNTWRLPFNPQAWLYRGQTVACPVCRQWYSMFKPYGTKLELSRQYTLISMGRRDNALCPGCGSKERDRAVALFLQELMPWFNAAGRHVLHIAPERSLSTRVRQLPGIRYLSGDLAPERSPQAAMQQIDIARIAYPDDSFDLIICNHVLEHIPDDSLAMRELFRVLKHDGYAILQVPYASDLTHTLEQVLTKPDERLRQYGQSDHVRLYSLDYIDRLRKSGFQVEAPTMNQYFKPDRVARYGLIAEERLFIGRKWKNHEYHQY